MKKFLLIIFLLASFVSFSQQGFPINQDVGGTKNTYRVRGVLAADSGYWFRTNFADTSSANYGQLKYVPGVKIRTGDIVWMRNNAANKWIKEGSSSSSSISNIYNNSVVNVTTYNDSCVIISTGSGSNDTACTNINIQNTQWINDSTLVVCGYIPPDTLTQVCDTLIFPGISLYLGQNWIRQPVPGVWEFGSNSPGTSPGLMLSHNTYTNTGYYKMNWGGYTVYDAPHNFSQTQSFQNGTPVVSWLHRGDQLNTGVDNTVKTYINYTDSFYSAGIEGYFGTARGYSIGTNWTGYGSFGTKLDNGNSKTTGFFLHTYDSSNTDGVTIYAAPDLGQPSPPLLNGQLKNYKTATFNTDGSVKFNRYNISNFLSVDTVNKKPLTIDNNGNVGTGYWFNGSSNDSIVDGWSFGAAQPYRTWQGVMAGYDKLITFTDRDSLFQLNNILSLYDTNGVLQFTKINAYTGVDGSGRFMSFGTGNYDTDTTFLVPVYNINSGGPAPYESKIIRYSATTFSVKNEYDIGSGVAESVFPYNGDFYVCYHNLMVIRKFNSSFVQQAEYTLSRPFHAGGGYQGIYFVGDSVFLNYHGPNVFGGTPSGGVDMYEFDGSAFTFIKNFAAPTYGSGQGFSIYNGKYYFADRPANRVVIHKKLNGNVTSYSDLNVNSIYGNNITSYAYQSKPLNVYGYSYLSLGHGWPMQEKARIDTGGLKLYGAFEPNNNAGLTGQFLKSRGYNEMPLWSYALGSLNGLTDTTQTFATGTTGADFNIISSGGTHTFHLPDAGTTTRGAVNFSTQSFAGVKSFVNGNSTFSPNNSSVDDIATITTNNNGFSRLRVTNSSAGTSAAAGNLYTNDAGINMQLQIHGSGHNTRPNWGLVRTANTAGVNLLLSADGGDLAFNAGQLYTTASTWRMIVKKEGNVGIGTNSPIATRLDIVHDALADSAMVSLRSNSTAAASNLQKGINISLSGANATSTQSTYSAYVSNTHTGTSSSNYAAYFSASGGTNNYALVIPASGGFFGFGTVTPSVPFEVTRTANISNTTNENLLSSTNHYITLDGTAITGNKTVFSSSGALILTLSANQTIPNSSDVTAVHNGVYFANSSPFTLTMTQGASSIRAVSATKSFFAFNSFNASSTISHMANFHIQSIQAPSISGNITNYYGLLIEPQTNNASSLTLANRWGIYQEGDNDRNYFAAPTGFGINAPTATRVSIVDNTVAGSSIMDITSTSTAAAGNLQKGINVSLSGANATSNQNTYGVYSSNTHTGTSSSNYGVYGTSSGGSVNYGVWGESTQVGVNGNGATGILGTGTTYAVRGVASSSGVGGNFNSVDGNAINGIRIPSSTNSTVTVMQLGRETTGTAADGIAGSIDLFSETDNGTGVRTNQLVWKLTTAANATYTSQLVISGVNSTTAGDIISFEGNKRTMLYGRLETQQGADVASAAGAIAMGLDGNVFEITGTAAITLISNLNWVNGSEITLIFTSTATLTDGTANSGTDIGMELAGNANFNATADDVITLVLSELGGTQRWREKSRSVN